MTTLACVRRLALGAILLTPLADAAAQAPGYGGPAMLRQPAWDGGSYVDAHGQPLVHPAAYGQPCGPMACGPGGYGPGGGGGYTPFPGSEMNTEQCGPHYFDFAAEFLHLNRDSPLGDDTVLSAIGAANSDGVVPANQIAIAGDDVDGGDYDGFRLTGRLDVGALSVFEFSYAGLFTDENDVVAVADPTTLSSVFTGFLASVGADNVEALAPNFQETDEATRHRLRFESDLHSVEASLRRYWVGYSPRVSGTLLAGFRYTELSELLEFDSTSDDGSIQIDLEADNHLAGVQVGGDAWVSVIQGFRIGGEIKAGLYNNDFETRTLTTGAGVGASRQSNNQVAFLTEAKAMAVVNLTPSLSLRGGYELLFISDLALVGDNLLANPPYGAASVGTGTPLPAAPPIDDQGDVFWDGFNFGLEYTY